MSTLLLLSLVDICSGGLLVPEVIIYPVVVNPSALE